MKYLGLLLKYLAQKKVQENREREERINNPTNFSSVHFPNVKRKFSSIEWER